MPYCDPNNFKSWIQEGNPKFTEHGEETKFRTLDILIRYVYPTTLDSLEKFMSEIDLSAVKVAKFHILYINAANFARISKILSTYPCVTELSVYDISNCSTQDLTNIVQSNKSTLVKLDISQIGFDANEMHEFCDALGEMPRIESISICHIHSSLKSYMERLVEVLSQCTTLKRLEFVNCHLAAKHMHYVAKIMTAILLLEAICVTGNNIRDLGCFILAPAIKAHPTLKKVGLTGCGIKNSGAKAIFEIMETNTTVECLALADNKLTIVAARAIASMIMHNQHMTGLGIGRNMLNTGAVLHILKALEFNRTLISLGINKMKTPLNEKKIIATLDSLIGKNGTICNLGEIGDSINGHTLFAENDHGDHHYDFYWD